LQDDGECGRPSYEPSIVSDRLLYIEMCAMLYYWPQRLRTIEILMITTWHVHASPSSVVNKYEILRAVEIILLEDSTWISERAIILLGATVPARKRPCHSFGTAWKQGERRHSVSILEYRWSLGFIL